jgi:HSP20 family molecular chaperone IbpA
LYVARFNFYCIDFNLQFPMPQVFVHDGANAITVILGCPGALESDYSFALDKKKSCLIITVSPSYPATLLTNIPPFGTIVNELATTTYKRTIPLPFNILKKIATKRFVHGMCMLILDKDDEEELLVLE